jgi:hypothetical protein
LSNNFTKNKGTKDKQQTAMNNTINEQTTGREVKITQDITMNSNTTFLSQLTRKLGYARVETGHEQEQPT